MQFARKCLAFVRSTVIGGVFVLAPLVLLVYLIGHALAIVYANAKPLMAWLPDKSVGGFSLLMLAAIVVLIGICFLAGLVAHTALARWLVRTIETAILVNLPGYTLMKSMGEGMVGIDRANQRNGVLVHFGDRAQVGFSMDETPDGRLIVFIPSVPSPWSGTLHILAPDRVERLTMPIAEVIDKLQRLGMGLGKMIPGEVERMEGR
jgi:uncharacterized membrane protein